MGTSSALSNFTTDRTPVRVETTLTSRETILLWYYFVCNSQLIGAYILVCQWLYPGSTSYITLLNAVSSQTVISSRKASSAMFILVGDDVTGS